MNPEHQKRPINFAVESQSYENLSALLRDPNVNLDSKYSSLTPINFLTDKISDNNFDEIFSCIKLLVKHFADLNIPNRREMTPILTILKNRHLNDDNKKEIAAYLLDNSHDIDIDSFRKGEARSLIQKLLPHQQLPLVRSNIDQQWDFNRLISLLRNENESEFLHGLNVLAETVEENKEESLSQLFSAVDNDETLLIAAIKNGLTAAVERILRLGADINYSGQKQRPIEYACIFGHWRILEILLKSPKVHVHDVENPLISIVVKNIGERVTNKCNYEKCFKLLLNHHDIDVDQRDLYHNSALHYAVKYNNRDAILELLKLGSYIGVKNHFNQYSISEISPKILEKHFDSCITTNGSRRGDSAFEIEFDYTNLVPPQTRKQNLKIANGMCDGKTEKCADEMAPIDFMSESNELRHLIKHPLIASFLFLKWNRLAFIFYVNFLLCAMFSASTVSYVLLCYNNEAETGALKTTLRAITFILTIYITLREIFQCVCSPKIYAKSLENYLEIALIVLTLLIIKGEQFSEGTRRTIGATTILLIAVELFLLAGSLPFWSFSTHYVMLKTVSLSFLKSFLLYAIILVAFSLSFFTLLRESGKPKTDQSNNESSSDDETDLNKFSNIRLSILKTLVMSTGEFEAANINFNSNTTSYIIFLIFLFLISTVLFNLLNGLAVSDTQVSSNMLW